MNLTRKYRLIGAAGTVFAGALLLYGCKDFLNTNAVPQGAVTGTTLTTQSGVEGMLIATYRALDCNYQTTNDWGCAVSNWVFGSIASDDAYEGSSAGDQPGAEQIELYHWSAPDAETYLNTKWTAIYDGVSRANATIRLLNTLLAANPTAVSKADADGIRGEATFLRAHFEFEAMRMWGNVPYYLENDTTDYRKANETRATAITDIEKDLNTAIGLLAATPRHGQVGRVTKWTATAYLGRVQMYANDYANAVTTFKSVVNSNVYALQPSYDQVWTGFKQYENGKETIFAYQASANDGNGDGENSNWGERLNFPSAGSPFGCCGFHQPSQNLVNYFRVDANGLPLALSSPGSWNTNDANFTGAQNTVAVDPRLDWTVGRDNVPFKDWGLHGAGWVRSIEHGGFYSAKKNVHEQASGAQSNVGWTNTQLNSVNIHIFRYADLLLMLAEAEAETNDLAGATALVNQVRTRAAAMVQGCGVPADQKAKTALVTAYPTCGTDVTIQAMAVPMTGGTKVMPWATYRISNYPTTFADLPTARAAIRAERRVELGMEGQRFFDLRRWGIEDSVLNGYVNSIGGGAEKNRLQQFISAGAVSRPKFDLYPIPDQQIQLSKVAGSSRLAQNPSW